MVSEEAVVCPYCKANHRKHDVIGNSGLINYCGSSFSMTCKNCGKDFLRRICCENQIQNKKKLLNISRNKF